MTKLGEDGKNVEFFRDVRLDRQRGLTGHGAVGCGSARQVSSELHGRTARHSS
jgi:hypothetical protein